MKSGSSSTSGTIVAGSSNWSSTHRRRWHEAQSPCAGLAHSRTGASSIAVEHTSYIALINHEHGTQEQRQCQTHMHTIRTMPCMHAPHKECQHAIVSKQSCGETSCTAKPPSTGSVPCWPTSSSIRCCAARMSGIGNSRGLLLCKLPQLPSAPFAALVKCSKTKQAGLIMCWVAQHNTQR